MFLILFLDGGDNMEPLMIFFSGNATAASAVVCRGGEKNKNKTSMVGTQADWKRPAIKSVFFFFARGWVWTPWRPRAEGGLNSTQPHLRRTLFPVPPLSINRRRSPVRLLFPQRCDSEKHFFSLSVSQHQPSSCSKSDPLRGSRGHLSDRQSAVCWISNYSLNCFFWTNIFFDSNGIWLSWFHLNATLLLKALSSFECRQWIHSVICNIQFPFFQPKVSTGCFPLCFPLFAVILFWLTRKVSRLSV